MTDWVLNAEEVVQRLLSAHSVLILTGAGVSKESGIATYREPQSGLWAQYDPDDLATVDGFLKNPKLVWNWNEHRRQQMLRARPNPAHYAIAELQDRLRDISLITQNIDGLHQRAGSREVIELHGSIHRHKCFANCQGDPTLVTLDQATTLSPEGVPLCPYCGGYLRHDIVWFHEVIPDTRWGNAWALADKADLVITVGTSGWVWPAAGFPARARERNGAFIVDVNPVVAEITHQADLHLKAPAGDILPSLARSLNAALAGQGEK